MDLLMFITDMASGGRQTVCKTLINELASMGKECSLYVSYGGGENLSAINKNVKVFISGKGISHSLRKLTQFVNKNPLTPCLSLSTEITIALCFLKKLRFIRNRIIHRESMDVGNMNLPWRILVRLFFPVLSGLIVTSKNAGDTFQKLYSIKNPVMVILNPCRFAGNFCAPPLNGKLLLSVGRLDPVKGHDRLLQSFYLHGNSFNMQIWGDGELKNTIAEDIKRYTLEKRVTLCGATRIVERVYASGGIVVLSSYQEGLPNVMIESILNGCRVVVPDCLSGACELLEEIGLSSCIVHGDYVSNLFTTIDQVVNIDKSIFSEAQALLTRKTVPSIVATQMVAFMKSL